MRVAPHFGQSRCASSPPEPLLLAYVLIHLRRLTVVAEDRLGVRGPALERTEIALAVFDRADQLLDALGDPFVGGFYCSMGGGGALVGVGALGASEGRLVEAVIALLQRL